MVSGAKPAKLLRRKLVGFQSGMKMRGISGVKAKHVGAGCAYYLSSRKFMRRDHPPTAQTPFPLNLNFGDLNATNSKN
jgi:hypothetical protein